MSRDQRVGSVEQGRQFVLDSDRHGVGEVTTDGVIGELTSFVWPQHRNFLTGAASCGGEALMHQLLCQHGHNFDAASSAGQRVVCPICGSVTTLLAEIHTPVPGPHDRTVGYQEPGSDNKQSKTTPKADAGRTVIVEAPKVLDEVPMAFGPTVDLPASPIEPPLSAASNDGNRTIICDATDFKVVDSFAPVDRPVKSASDSGSTPRNETDATQKPPVVASSLTAADGGNRTVIFEATAPKVSESFAPVDSPAKPVVDSVAAPREQTVPIQRSITGLRTTTRMETEVDVTEPPDLPGYKVISELGRGGMGVVYQVYDKKLDRHVALKTLQRISPIGLQRFKQEFRSLADISHPNLAGPYDLLSDGKTWCFTMEILEAVEFLEYVWSEFEKLKRDKSQKLVAESSSDAPRLSPTVMQRLKEGLKQVALGLNALHDAGMLHRDIKPSNILVTTEGRVVLVDFGLAAQIESDGRPQGIQGTPDYMAPEQAAGKPVTPASDWYAVGVMLYELLTGRMPIEGKALQVIFKKQKETPKQPRELEPSIPQELNDLCVALLDRDPSKRPTVFDVLRLVGADEEAESLRGNTSKRSGQAIQLVGREQHLVALRQAFQEVHAGSTRSVFVHGKSGMGKSVLIQTFLEELKGNKQAMVLSGRCYEQESVPFKALDSLIDSLVGELGKLPEETLRLGVPEDSLPLVRLFPVMGQLPSATDAGKPPIDNVDQRELRERAMNALRELLRWLGARQPVVLYIDDLQWGDEDSAELLGDLVRPPDSPRVMLLGSYRSEYVQTSLCLKALATSYATGQAHPHRQELAVESLSEEDASRLAMLLLKRDDLNSMKFATKIARESGGWPFFVWELVQHVQEAPEIADQTLELDEVIWTRVCRLPEETRHLLEIIAVAGRPIVSAEAYRALNVGAKGQNLLVQLRTRNLIRATESQDESTVIESYHDRIRQSVVNHLDERTTKRYNLDLAETILQLSGISVENVWEFLNGATPFEEPTEIYQLERRQWRRVYDLSHFFSAAGEQSRALPFAVIAAEQTRRQNALEVAEQMYRAALLGIAAFPVALRFRVHEGLGDVLVLRGKYAEAIEQFEAARVLAQAELVLARIDWKLGVASFKKGDMGDACGSLEKSIKALGEQAPTKLTVVPRLVKEASIQVLHTKFPAKFVGQHDPESAQARLDLFRARVYDQLTITYWFTRGMKFVLWSHLRQMNLAERYPPSAELGKTYAFHAVAMTGLPLAKRGIKYAKRAYDISVEKGDLWGQGKARSFHTFSCIVLATFKEGIQTGAEAVRLLEQAGDIWEANMARMIRSVPMYHSGDLKGAYREAKKAYEIGMETGDYSAACIALLFWIPAAPHTIPPGAIKTEMERERVDPLAITSTYFTRGLELLLAEDKPRDAIDMLQKMLDEAARREFRDCCLFAAVSWKATACRIVAEREPEGPVRRVALRKAKKAVGKALSITKLYHACRPQALREAGLVASLEGNEDAARRFLDESLRVATDHDARYDIAKTRLAQAETGMKFGWPGSAEQAAEALTVVKDLENVEEN